MRETISLVQAAEHFAAFIVGNIQDGTAVVITADYAEEISRTARNQVSMATSQGVDVDKQRQAYEAVGWLCVQVEAWLHDSPYDDELLEEWAKSLLFS